MQQSPATVFISNDQKYYIIGDLHNAKGENLTIKALETHVKDAVLDDVWKSLENSTWIQDGQKMRRGLYMYFQTRIVRIAIPSGKGTSVGEGGKGTA